MSEERLLERIRNLERNPQERAPHSLSREVDSIINHLQRLLNTRQGSTVIAEDYGIPDITNFPGSDFSETAREMEQVLKDVVQRFEPRLARVQASFSPQRDDLLTLRFKIEAVLARDKSTPVAFETVVNAEGRVNVLE